MTSDASSGWVEVEVQQTVDVVEIVVRDSGPGVATTIASEVFEHGFTTKAARGGERGIGLALTRRICRTRGGDVEVRDTSDGAEFAAWMTVRAAPIRESKGDPVGSAGRGSMITVLVVDDDFRVARIHSAFVDRVAGFRTIGVANTGQEAIRLAVALAPDLILLDLYLPDVFGLDVLNRMRVAGVEGDAIVISAANESETVERAVKLGAVNYLLKPFTSADLVQRLQHYQDTRAAARPRTLGGQAEVDQILGRGDTGRSEPLPKGLSPETAESILAALAAAGTELSAQECADAVGIARVSARRYLEFFVAQGRVRLTLRYGARGRPERRYAVLPTPT